MEPTNTNPRHNLDPQLAKKMVESYQAALSDPNSTRALTFDADEIRNYLNDTSIKNFVVFLAHTDEWAIDHFGIPNTSKTTVVLAGTNVTSNGVPNSDGCVLDYADMCPSHCSNTGSVIFDDM